MRHVSLGTAIISVLSISVSAMSYGFAAPATDVQLGEAIRRGDNAVVQSLLRAHAPVNVPEGDGSTPLHWAAYSGNAILVKQLLNAHADPQAKTRLESITPLMMACQNGSAEIVKLLLDHGADANLANSLGSTPLMFAAASGHVETVDLLLERGARINEKEKPHGQTALMFAAAYNRTDAAKTLLKHGADPNARTFVTRVAKLTIGKGGNLIVTEPGQMDSKEVQEAEARYLNNAVPSGGAAKPAVPKSAEGNQKQTAVTESADDIKKRRRREHGATVMGGMTALLYAARQGNIQATVALVEGGADINQPSGSEHTTPLTLAIANGHFDEARILIEHGANVNMPNDQGIAPLYAAIDVVYSPHEWSAEPISDQENTKLIPLLQLLIAHGSDVNARTRTSAWERTLSENRAWSYPGGSTAFFRAAEAGDMDAMKMLKAAGADPNIPTVDGTTPLMAAAGLGWAPNYTNTTGHFLAAVEYCVSLGANPDTRDNLGYSALHGAAIVGDTKVIQYLVDHGAKPDAKSKAGDYPADFANGPFEKSVPHPEVVAFMEKLGSPNSHNCRSSECVVPVKDDKPTAAEAAKNIEAATTSSNVSKAAPKKD